MQYNFRPEINDDAKKILINVNEKVAYEYLLERSKQIQSDWDKKDPARKD